MALIILFKFRVVAERRQWSSAASNPRRKMRVKLDRSTVCRALQQLKVASLFVVRHCIRRNHTFAANSYFFLRTAHQDVPNPGLSLLKFYTPRPSQVNAVLV